MLSPTIVFESPELVVLNKPAGMLTHPKHLHDQSLSIIPLLLDHYPEVATVGDQPTLRPGIVHRLDKDTSGLIVVARTQNAFLKLKEQFQSRTISKTYLAVVYGIPSPAKGNIDRPLGKIGVRQSTRIHGKHELNEKSALTEYEVKKGNLLEVRPRTGRTHQIRVHLNSIGHPVVGDPLYGGKQGKADYAILRRFLLHAQKLSFITPRGEALSLEADPPEDFLKNDYSLAEFKKIV